MGWSTQRVAGAVDPVVAVYAVIAGIAIDEGAGKTLGDAYLKAENVREDRGGHALERFRHTQALGIKTDGGRIVDRLQVNMQVRARRNGGAQIDSPADAFDTDEVSFRRRGAREQVEGQETHALSSDLAVFDLDERGIGCGEARAEIDQDAGSAVIVDLQCRAGEDQSDLRRTACRGTGYAARTAHDQVDGAEDFRASGIDDLRRRSDHIKTDCRERVVP